MLKKFAAKIWEQTPRSIRLRVIRLTQPKFTCSVAAVIVNKENKILLLEHNFRPVFHWGMPGGFLEFGENPEEAIHREIFEEIKLELKNVKLYSVRTIGRHIEILFLAEADGELQPDSREINDANWFNVGEMPENMSPVQKSIVKQMFESRK